MAKAKIIGVYDNRSTLDALFPGWGFSALLSLENRRILFDTGADVRILSENMRALGIAPKSLDGVFLSHPHCDHVGGLSAILKENTELTLYLTESFPESQKKKILSYGADLFQISGSQELTGGIWTTGEMTFNYRGVQLPEQSLIFRSDKGPVVISGCAHPGIAKILRKATEISGNPPYLALGGFHLASKKPGEIRRVIKDFRKIGVRTLAPCHCTGDRAIRMISDEFGESYRAFRAGDRLAVG